jgi:hypothetical protein
MKQTAVEWLYERLERMIPRTALYDIDKREYFQQAKEMEKQQIIEHSVELAKLLFSNPIEKSGKTPEELVNSYFKNK